MKINSKAFAIPILTALYSTIIKPDVVRIGIANALELIFIQRIINLVRIGIVNALELIFIQRIITLELHL